MPVVNVDGFKISRAAAPRGDFSTFDYEMKRKNCRISAATPAQYTTGPCDNNLAGRLRGTDLNRNYPGFWGGGGASPVWSSDTFRGDGPGSEPESDAVRKLISERAVTMMISNHTYSNLVLRPPAIAATGLAIDEPELKALGDAMASKNDYVSQASYQLYDTSGSTEDWSYWITGGFGYTFEIGDEGFHPAYEEAVVGEYLGLAPADGAGLGGNREAYWLATAGSGRPRPALGHQRHRPGQAHDQRVQDRHVGDLAGHPARRHDRSAAAVHRHPDHRVHLEGRPVRLRRQPLDPSARDGTVRSSRPWHRRRDRSP